uniref:Collagen alpha-2(VIII) chain n=1 Tax=Magallana gigas TaxID=29159 RepID=K1R4Q7_MAGGI
MDSKTAVSYAAIFCVILISYTVAEQQNSSRNYLSFLSSYASYQDICRKIGWEPKCSPHTVNECKGKTIAFHAILPSDVTNTPINTIIKFQKVQVNEGGGYNPATGKFTAPVDGVYSFSWTYHTNKGSVAYLGGYVDGTIRTYIGTYTQANTWQSQTGNLVIKLKKGSQFWVQTYLQTVQHLSGKYTFLSGYKISGC